MYKHLKISKSGVGLRVCAWERQREKKRNRETFQICDLSVLKNASTPKSFWGWSAFRCLFFFNTHEEKWWLKNVIHMWQLYWLIFLSHKFPVIAKAFIPSIVQTQLIPYIMCESDWQDTPSAVTTKGLLRRLSNAAIRAQDKKTC